jgi:NAD-dependent DNA ligase
MMSPETFTAGQLETMIVEAAEAYYLETPTISDELFNKLVENLRLRNPLSPLLTQVGWGCMRKAYRNKVPLPVKIRSSLPKIQYEDFDLDGPLVGSPKVDGMSCVLHYSNGVLKQAVTRGDGEFGIDITPKMRKIRVPSTIESKENLFIRGELYIYLDTFERFLKDEYANPRNAVAGIVNSKSYDKLEYVSFGAHPQDDVVLLDIDDQEKLGILPTWRINKLSDIEDAREKSLLQKYPLDGVVLHLIGIGDAVAIKFQTESKETTVTKVTWEERRGGKMIPVVWYRPVRLYGTECCKCSGFNYAYISSNRIGPGATIKLTKANEIIPYITEVTSPGKFAPNFEGMNVRNFKVDGAHLFHVRFDHYQYSLEKFVAWHYNIDNFKRPKVILEALQVQTFTALVSRISQMSREEIISNLNRCGVHAIADKVADKLKSKIYINYFFQQFAVNGIGPVEAEKLQGYVVQYCTYEYFDMSKLGIRANVVLELGKEGIIKLISECYLAYHNANLWEEKMVEDTSHKMRFCISGRLPSGLKKSEFAKLMPDNYKMVDYVDRNVVLLISEEDNTSKVKIARTLKTPIMNEEEARRKFEIE